MWVSRKARSALTLAALTLGVTSAASAEVKLVEAGGWTVTTDGRVNAFVSHVYGDPRPDGLAFVVAGDRLPGPHVRAGS